MILRQDRAGSAGWSTDTGVLGFVLEISPPCAVLTGNVQIKHVLRARQLRSFSWKLGLFRENAYFQSFS